MYRGGNNHNHNDVIAHMWLNVASANGQAEAPEVLKIIEGNMSRQDVLAAQQLARQCVENNYKNCGEQE